MRDEMNEPFAIGGKGLPLWRLRMIRSPTRTDLILPISHSIVDALGNNYSDTSCPFFFSPAASLSFLTGMTVFFTDLLRYYSKIARGETVEIVSRKEISPAVERVLPGSSVSRGGVLGAIGEFASKMAISSSQMRLKLPLRKSLFEGGERNEMRSVPRELPYDCLFRAGTREGKALERTDEEKRRENEKAIWSHLLFSTKRYGSSQSRL